MKNTTAMADYELRHIEALRKDLAGCTVLLKKDGSFQLIRRAETPEDYFATFDFSDFHFGK